MKVDLTHALDSVVASAEAAARPVPIDRLLPRVHRGRTMRTATYSAISIGTAAAVGVGAFALNTRQTDPVPPATTGPSRTPTDKTASATSPTPSPESSTAPTDWDVDYSPCGQDFTSIGWTQSDIVTLTPTVAPQSDSQAMLTVETYDSLKQGTGSTIVETGTQHQVVALSTARGTVVGVRGTPAGQGKDTMVPIDPHADAAQQGHVATTAPLFSCTTEDGSRLEAGGYDLRVAQRIATQDADGHTTESLAVTAQTLAVPQPEALRTPKEHTLPYLLSGERAPMDYTSTVPASDGPLEDGDYYGYLQAIDTAGGTVDVDIAVFTTGQPAIDAAMASDTYDPATGITDEFLTGVFFITNDVQRVRTLPLSPNVRIWNNDDVDVFTEQPLATWSDTVDWPDARDRGTVPGPTYWFDVRNGVVVQVVGQWSS